MPVQRNKHTSSRRDRRRGQLRLLVPQVVRCLKCWKATLPHQVCMNCGTWRGREVIDVLAKLSKKERKKREKEMKVQEKEQKQEGKEAAPAVEGIRKPVEL